MINKTRVLGTALLTLLLGTVSVSAAAKTSADKVKVETSAGKVGPEGTQDVTLTLNVEEGWHLYANPVGNVDLASAQTTVKISGKTKLNDVKIEYPKGKVVKDKTVGDYSTYEGKVVIKAKVSRAKGDTGPLDVTIKLQACDEKICLPPGKINVKVE